MFIAHLPTGYITTRFFAKKWADKTDMKVFMLAGISGSIAPDLDMIYFYLIDQRQHHHHSYYSHYPVIWFSLLVLSVAYYRLAQNRPTAILGIIFSVNGCVHLLLDSVVADVWWFAPFVDKGYAMFIVTARYDPWWLNFIFHWSFLLEVALCLWALHLWQSQRRNDRINLL